MVAREGIYRGKRRFPSPTRRQESAPQAAKRRLAEGGRYIKIGLRIPGAMSRDRFVEYVGWCKENRFDAIDLGGPDAAQAKTVRDAGLEVGTIDLRGTGKLCASDETVRKEGITEAVACINGIA